MTRNKIIEVKNLKTYFYTKAGVGKAVDGVSFDIFSGETLGIVGESGCGKSVTALSIMRLIKSPPGKIVEGEIHFNNKNLTKLNEEQMRKIRGGNISMIFQEPMTSLNPLFTVGDQIMESILIHKGIKKKQARQETIEILKKVGIPLPEQRADEYSYQLSGGMRQRIMIAMALSCEPQLLIADEPTTALDVTIQAQILELMKDLKDRFAMSIMLITHDLGVIAEVADRVAVMYGGKIVEYADVETIFKNTLHPYTWGLMNSIPSLTEEVERLETIPGTVPNLLNFPKGCRYHLRCPLSDNKCITEEPKIKEVKPGHMVRCWHYEKLQQLKKRKKEVSLNNPLGKINKVAVSKTLVEVKNLKKYFPVKKGIFRKIVGYVKAVDDISFRLREGETLGIVGESGCGKTTAGRTIIRLVEASSGEIWFGGHNNILGKNKRELRSIRKEMQIIFQDPYSSLNPRMTVEEIVGEPLDIHHLVKNGDDRMEKIKKLLKSVGMEAEHMNRYPHEFSGGQRQRIGIARALASNPRLIVADEPVSALDVCIQAQVINLMKDLQKDYGLTYIFISHDLGVVKHISNRVAVMYLGKIVELADKKELFANPLHPYTLSLLSAIPILDPTVKKDRIILKGDVPSPLDPPPGCPFHPRCPEAIKICSQKIPEFKDHGNEHFVACHLLESVFDNYKQNVINTADHVKK